MFPVLNWFFGDLGVNVLRLHTHFSGLDPAQLWQQFVSWQEMGPCESQYQGQIFIFKYKMISYSSEVFGFPLLSARLV